MSIALSNSGKALLLVRPTAPFSASPRESIALLPAPSAPRPTRPCRRRPMGLVNVVPAPCSTPLLNPGYEVVRQGPMRGWKRSQRAAKAGMDRQEVSLGNEEMHGLARVGRHRSLANQEVAQFPTAGNPLLANRAAMAGEFRCQ